MFIAIALFNSSQNQNLLTATSQAAYQGLIGGMWASLSFKYLNNVIVPNNFPVTGVPQQGFPDYYSMKSNTNDTLFQMLWKAEPNISSIFSNTSVSTFHLGYIDSPNSIIEFMKVYARTTAGAILSNYLDTTPNNKNFDKLIQPILAQFNQALTADDPVSLLSKDPDVNFIAGLIPHNPLTSSTIYNGFGLSAPIMRGGMTIAVNNNSSDGNVNALRNLYAQVKSGSIDMHICDVFQNFTYTNGSICTSQYVDYNFYNMIIENCSQKGNQTYNFVQSINATYPTWNSLIGNNNCVLYFGDQVALDQMDSTQFLVFNATNIYSVLNTTYHLMVPIGNQSPKKGNSQLSQETAEGYKMLNTNNTLENLYTIHFGQSIGTQSQSQQTVHTLFSPENILYDGVLMKVLLSQHATVVMLTDSMVVGKNMFNYEYQVLQGCLNQMSSIFGTTIDLRLITVKYNKSATDLKNKTIPQNEYIMHLMTDNISGAAQNASLNPCQGGQCNFGIGLLPIQNFQQGVVYTERFFDGTHSWWGNKTANICHLSNNGTYFTQYEQQNVELVLSNQSSYTYNPNNTNLFVPFIVDNYTEMIKAVQNGSCQTFTVNEMAYYNLLPENFPNSDLSNWNRTVRNSQTDGPFFAPMMKADNSTQQFARIQTFTQSLIQYQLQTNSNYYFSIVLIYTLLCMAVFPVMAVVIFLNK